MEMKLQLNEHRKCMTAWKSSHIPVDWTRAGIGSLYKDKGSKDEKTIEDCLPSIAMLCILSNNFCRATFTY